MYKLSVQTYQLTIAVNKPARIQIGKLGMVHFSVGHFLYTGSAKRNIIQRVTRHFNNSKSKKLRWHIDYFLDYLQVHNLGKIIDVRFFAMPECQLNQNSTGEILIPGFGSSDCKQHCGSHLKFRSKHFDRINRIT